MEQDFLGDDALEFSVMGAMSRQHEADARTFLRSLALLLEQVLPNEATIQRSGLFGGDKRPIRRIEVTLPDGDSVKNTARFTIEDEGHGPLLATKTQVVRGIALKSETLPVADWIAGVAGGITKRASDNHATRNALAGLV